MDVRERVDALAGGGAGGKLETSRKGEVFFLEGVGLVGGVGRSNVNALDAKKDPL